MAEINVQINQYKQLTNNYDQLHPETGAEITSLTPETQAKFPSGILNTDAALAYLAESSVGNAKNVTATYPVAAGKIVTQGDIVDIVNGEVTLNKAAKPGSNVINTISGQVAGTGVKVIWMNNDISIYATRNPSSGTLSVGAIYNETGLYATSYQVSSDAIPNSISQFDIIKLDETHILAFYCFTNNNCYARIGTVNSSTSISFGTPTTVGSFGGSLSDIKAVALTSTKIAFITFTTNYGLAMKIGNVNGTAITMSGGNWTGVTFSSGAYKCCALSPTLIAVLISNKTTAPTGSYIFMFSVVNDTTIQVKDGILIEAGVTTNIAYGCVFNSTINELFVALKDNTDNLIVHSLSYANETLTLKNRGITKGLPFAYGTLSYVGETLLLNAGNSTRNLARIYTLIETNDSIVFNSYYDYFTGDVKYPGISDSPTANFIGVNANGRTSNSLQTTLLHIEDNVVGGEITNSSSTAISLSNATAGQPCDVIYSGIIAAPWVTENQIITSDGQGVYGLGVLDGFLQVYAKNRPGKIVTGTYAGNGTYGLGNPNTITFAPGVKAVFIGDTGQGGGANCIVGLWTPFMYRGSINVNQSTDLIWTATSLKWYNMTNAYDQMNSTGTTYHYVLFY